MSQFAALQEKKYADTRSVSRGADITLHVVDGGTRALFQCASRIAKILGSEKLKDYGDGIYESIPCYDIPISEHHAACTKLSEHYSIAIVDVMPATDKNRSLWGLLWKINKSQVVVLQAAPTKVMSVEDF